MESLQKWGGNFRDDGGDQEIDSILEKLYCIKFNSYVKKTIMETRKHYFIQEKIYQERICQEDLEEVIHEMNPISVVSVPEWRPGYLIEDQDLLKSLQALTKKQQTIIAGYYLQEKTEGELSRELKISRQAVNRIRKRALVNIKKNLMR